MGVNDEGKVFSHEGLKTVSETIAVANEFAILELKGANLLAVLGGVSVFTERVVEIVKGWAPPLNRSNPPDLDPMVEARRRAYNQLASVAVASVVGVGIAIRLDVIGSKLWAYDVLLLAVLASGGSGFWNGVLGALGVLSVAAPPRPRVPGQPIRPDADQGFDEGTSVPSREDPQAGVTSREEGSK